MAHAPARQGPARGVAFAFHATCVKGCRAPVHGPKAVVHASGPAAVHALHKVNSQFRRRSEDSAVKFFLSCSIFSFIFWVVFRLVVFLFSVRSLSLSQYTYFLERVLKTNKK